MSLTRRPNLVTGIHSLPSALPPRAPRPQPQPQTPDPGRDLSPGCRCQILLGSHRGLPFQGPRGLPALQQHRRHPPFGVPWEKKNVSFFIPVIGVFSLLPSHFDKRSSKYIHLFKEPTFGLTDFSLFLFSISMISGLKI